MAKEQDSDQEPSIEEILDSIRQIISDDEQPAAEAPAPKKEDDVIELTQKVEPPKAAAPPPPPPPPKQEIEVDMTDFDIPEEPPVRKPEPRREAPPPPPRRPEPIDSGDNIFTQNVEDSVMGAFDEINRRAAIERAGTVTVEDIVREELRPMLRQWLDHHLPQIVEKLLQQEIERISKRFDDN